MRVRPLGNRFEPSLPERLKRPAVKPPRAARQSSNPWLATSVCENRHYNAAVMQHSKAKSGRCAIIGRPNVGKSTLLNALIGQKLAIATHRPQTTRSSLLGVYASDTPPTQIAFVDTPGLHRPENALGRALLENAKAELAGADVVVLLVEVGGRTDPVDLVQGEHEDVLAKLKGQRTPVILGLNKIDRLNRRSDLLPLLQSLQTREEFAAMVPICARTGSNLDGLIAEIRHHLPEGLSYDPEVLTDKPERFFASELIREAVMVQTRQEVPYSVAVSIDRFVDEPAITRIAATIVVAREGHKGIVIGKGGERLKEIGTLARKGMEELLQRKVFVELWVKVVPNWTDDPKRVRELVREE